MNGRNGSQNSLDVRPGVYEEDLDPNFLAPCSVLLNNTYTVHTNTLQIILLVYILCSFCNVQMHPDIWVITFGTSILYYAYWVIVLLKRRPQPQLQSVAKIFYQLEH